MLHSLPPLQKQPEFWGLALLADLHCSVGVVWVPALLPCWHHGLPHPLLVSLINLHSSFLAIYPSCKQPELSGLGLALLADLHCDVGVVEVGQCCCHAGIMACQHYLCHGALLLPSIACQPLVQVAHWSLLCKLLLPTCTCMFACHVACMHDSTSRDMQRAHYIGCATAHCTRVA